MARTEVVAMILAGGQGSRLGVLTKTVAKPAVPFGSRYRIIDFPLSNCVNSGIEIVGVLTQYQPLALNTYVGNGHPWDLDRNNAGAYILPPFQSNAGSDWYKGTANAIYQNMSFIDDNDPEYVVILSGDHIYKMDYAAMLKAHIEKNADATIAVYEVPWDEAPRFGILNTKEDDVIEEFEEKPANPKSNLASMGIYIFNWKVLKEALIKLKDQQNCDFGMHIIPYCFEQGRRIFSYEYTGYWKDVGTLGSYWEANMELIDIVPDFNLYEEFWKIYTKSDSLPPQYIAGTSVIEKSIVGAGCTICGEVYNSVISPDVTIEEGAVVKDSIIMQGSVIKSGTKIDKSIIAERSVVGKDCEIGFGESAPSKLSTKIYAFDLAVIGENSVIPDGVKIGKNTAISGETDLSDYTDGELAAGDYIIKAGEI